MKTAKGLALTLLLSLVLSLALAVGTAQGRTYDAEELRFIQLINDYRAQNGLQPLLASGTLAEAAARHSLDMGKHSFFSHTSVRSSFFPAGYLPWDRMASLGYPSNAAMSENIAGGQSTAQQVFNSWKASAGHRQNMLGSAYRVIGVARRVVAGSPYGVYWTTDFGSVVDSSAVRTTSSTSSGSSSGAPFTDVTKSDLELWNAALYVKGKGYFNGYPSGALGCWEPLTHRHVALVLKRAGLGSRTDWEQDYRAATRGEVMQAFPGLSWNSGRAGEKILRSQLVRLLYRAR